MNRHYHCNWCMMNWGQSEQILLVLVVHSEQVLLVLVVHSEQVLLVLVVHYDLGIQ